MLDPQIHSLKPYTLLQIRCSFLSKDVIIFIIKTPIICAKKTEVVQIYQNKAKINPGRRDHMVVVTTTYAISAYHH